MKENVRGKGQIRGRKVPWAQKALPLFGVGSAAEEGPPMGTFGKAPLPSYYLRRKRDTFPIKGSYVFLLYLSFWNGITSFYFFFGINS
jgi:hypothetical protein